MLSKGGKFLPTLEVFDQSSVSLETVSTITPSAQYPLPSKLAGDFSTREQAGQTRDSSA